jgi:hypothetical protein
MVLLARQARLLANEPPPLSRRNYEQMPLLNGETVDVVDGDLLHAEGACLR